MNVTQCAKRARPYCFAVNGLNKGRKGKTYIEKMNKDSKLCFVVLLLVLSSFFIIILFVIPFSCLCFAIGQNPHDGGIDQRSAYSPVHRRTVYI